MILAAFIIFILHEIQISADTTVRKRTWKDDLCSPVKGVEGVFEEERQQTVGPGVCPEQVQHAEAGTRVADPGQELKLERGLAVKLALNVVLEHQLS